MQIAIDIRMLSPILAGIGRYIENLIPNLIKIDKINQYLLITNNRDLSFNLEGADNFQLKKISASPLTIQEQIVLPTLIQQEQIDLFHAPSYVAPIFRNCSNIMTIHDMIHYRCSDGFRLAALKKLYYRTVLKYSANKANLIITDSLNSKKDIREILGQDERKVRVITLGISKQYRPIEDNCKIDLVKEKYGIGRDYILYVGSFLPSKNVPRLLKAFSYFKHTYSKDYALVVVGSKLSPYFPALQNMVEELDLGSDVFFTGFVPDDELILIYNGASLFVFISCYEGFGFPPLEAMACGTPVITSNTSSLPEVVGDAGIMVNPYNIEEIAEAMYKLLSDQNLQNEMRRQGIERAKQFSWEETAKQTLHAYQEVFNGRISV